MATTLRIASWNINSVRLRIDQVARMLGGIDLTKESLAHAKKMVVTAKI